MGSSFVVAALGVLYAGRALAAPTSTGFPWDGGNKKLVFDSDGHFKVVSFSDMHFGERNGDGSWAPWGPINDARTQVGTP